MRTIRQIKLPIVCVVGVFLTLFFYWSLLLHLYEPVSLKYPDAQLGYFIFDHYRHVFLTGDWNTIFNLRMFYGFEKSLFFSEHLLGQALIIVPLSIVFGSTIAAVNLFIHLISIGTFLAMYLLTWHWTRRTIASLIGAMLFTFSPYVTSRTPDQINLYTIVCIPLLFLAFDRWIEKPTNSRALLFFVLAAVQVLVGLNYAVYLVVMLVLYGVMRLRFGLYAYRKLVNRGAMIGMVLLLLVVCITAVSYMSVGGVSFVRPQQVSEAFSARPADIFFSAPVDSALYGWMRGEIERVVPWLVSYETLTDGSIFLGVLPIGLAVIGSIVAWRGKGIGREWIVMFLMSLLLSFGPVVHMTDTMTIPGLYRLISSFFPLFVYFRAPERFGVFVYLFLGLLCARGCQAMMNHTGKHGVIFGIVLMIGITAEYSRTPLSFVQIPDDLRQMYRAIDNRTDVHVLLELPMGNNIGYGPSARSILYDTQYILWATILHQKLLLNGYSGTIPDMYYTRSSTLGLGVFTGYTLTTLNKSGVDMIVVHRDEYPDARDFEKAEGQLDAFMLPKTVYARAVVYDLTHWKNNSL